MGGCKERREPAKEQQYGNRSFFISGNPAVIGPSSLRPVALRLRLLTDLPLFSQAKYDQKLIDDASAPFAEIFIGLNPEAQALIWCLLWISVNIACHRKWQAFC